MGRLIIDGNSVYEIDEECMRQKEQKERKQEKENGLNVSKTEKGNKERK